MQNLRLDLHRTFFLSAALTMVLAVLPYQTLSVSAISYDTTDIIPPKIKDVAGREILQAGIGTPAVLAVGIENNENRVHPFVLLVEIRDTDGITIFLAWQSGTLNPIEQSEVGLSWTPERIGGYEVRSFAITNLQDPQVLSEVQSREIKVGKQIEYRTTAPTPTSQESSETNEQQDDNPALAPLKQHALKRINEDRAKFGLEPVQLSNNIAAQIHAEDVFRTKKISHWMTNGEKPYMTYSKYDGIGAVGQNVAVSGDKEYYEGCTSGKYLCGRINPFDSIDRLEYLMMYEDEECCDNGHRDNILDPYHTHVSIGIAYDDYFFVIVQNFEDNYIEFEKPVTENGRTVRLAGNLPPGTTFSVINIFYDEPPTPAVYEKNRDNDSYDLGEIIAGVTDGNSYYSGIETITAGRWEVTDNSIDIVFDLEPIQDERGVYTIWVFLEDVDGRPFPIMSYSVL